MNKELKDTIIIPFIINFLAIVLGVFITFAGQAQIDKKHEKEGIATGLNLVKKELLSNIEDIRYAHSDMEAVSNSASYLYSHINDLASCPSDSVAHHWETFTSKAYLTLPQDALQMLKSTYLYSDLLDRELALSVVRAYDICEALELSINNAGEHRINSIEKINEFFLLEADKGKKPADTQTWISSFQGRDLLQNTSEQNGYWIDGAIQDLEAVISEIDSYL